MWSPLHAGGVNKKTEERKKEREERHRKHGRKKGRKEGRVLQFVFILGGIILVVRSIIESLIYLDKKKRLSQGGTPSLICDFLSKLGIVGPCST